MIKPNLTETIAEQVARAIDGMDEEFQALVDGDDSGNLEKTLEVASRTLEALAASDQQGQVNRRRNNGIYYTAHRLAEVVVKESLSARGGFVGTFLEPCVGGGAFYFTFINEAFKYTDGSSLALQDILNRCFIADNDSDAISFVLLAGPKYFLKKYGHSVVIPEQNAFCGDSLWEDSSDQIRDLRRIFNSTDGFDFIMTNPPYRLLKANRRDGDESVRFTQHLSDRARKTEDFLFIQGTPNLYKLFVEAILLKWLSADGVAGLLVPRSLLSDTQSERLRRYVLDHFRIGCIYEVDEGSGFFSGIGQAFSLFTLTGSQQSEHISFGHLLGGEDSDSGLRTTLDIETIKKVSPTLAVLNLSSTQVAQLEELLPNRRVKDFQEIVNLRGEYDITLDASFIESSGGQFPLIAGADIAHYKLKESRVSLDVSFLDRPKGKWVATPRIACQQISNRNQSRRLKWAYIPEGHVLANSCNFIAIASSGAANDAEEYLYFLLGVLNSDIVNERFKILSANNHVSNHEINTLPIPDASPSLRTEIASFARDLCEQFDAVIFEKLEKLVNEAFQSSQAKRTRAGDQ